MKLNEYNDLSNIPGIYLIRNKVNNKCYVGQTIRLKTRMQDHYSTAISSKCENQRKRMLLYKAIEKYGVDNFEYSILFSEDTKEFNKIKSKLDDLEKKYIVEYNSYVPTGYNQTKGGDAGVLGLKMTDEQKELISKNARTQSMDGSNMVYCYDMIENVYYTMVNVPALNSVLGTNIRTSAIRNKCYKKRYIIARSKNDLEQKIESYNNLTDSHFIDKYCKDMERDLKNGISEKEFCAKYNVCRKSYNNYKKRAIPGYKRIYKTTVSESEFIKFYSEHPNIKECSKHFGLSEHQCYRYRNRWIK